MSWFSSIRLLASVAAVCAVFALVMAAFSGLTGTSHTSLVILAPAAAGVIFSAVDFVAILVAAVVRGRGNLIAVVMIVVAACGSVFAWDQTREVAVGATHVAHVSGWHAQDCDVTRGRFHWGRYCRPDTI